MTGLAILAVLYGLVFCGLWVAEKGVHIMTESASLPRVGGIIEDETGWWQIIDVDQEGAWLMDKRGKEVYRLLGNLGHVSYDQ